MKVFKENYKIFSRKNCEEINNRILLAFDINPYNKYTKIYWE